MAFTKIGDIFHFKVNDNKLSVPTISKTGASTIEALTVGEFDFTTVKGLSKVGIGIYFFVDRDLMLPNGLRTVSASENNIDGIIEERARYPKNVYLHKDFKKLSKGKYYAYYNDPDFDEYIIMKSGVVCEDCKEFFPWQNYKNNFKCWACVNGPFAGVIKR